MFFFFLKLLYYNATNIIFRNIFLRLEVVLYYLFLSVEYYSVLHIEHNLIFLFSLWVFIDTIFTVI